MPQAKRSSLNIDNLSGFEFEDLVAKIMDKVGYYNIQIMDRTNDKGKDILMNYEKDSISYPVVVECKHMESVGRPVIQKLQGAMLHEKRSSSHIKGIVVTSGKFSSTVKKYVDEINRYEKNQMEIELIDGKKLREICENNNIVILNGKVQVITDKVVEHLSKNEIKIVIEKKFKTIIGSNTDFLKSKIDLSFIPSYCIQYDINSSTSTNVGCIYKINAKDQRIVLEANALSEIDSYYYEHFFKSFPNLKHLDSREKEKIVPFEFSENEIEKKAIDLIIKKYTKNVRYIGGNNVSYNKICKPKFKDIRIDETFPIYLPRFENNINVIDNNYKQIIFANRDKLLYTKDELDKCIVCGKNKVFFDENKYLCSVCGKILCAFHRKLDYLNQTPICLEHAISRKLFIQNIYFASKKSLKQFNEIWGYKNIISKIFTDKILTGLIIFLIIFLTIIGFNLIL